MLSRMDSIDPCCGGSLERATKYIAIIDIIFSVATTCVIWFLILITLFYQPEIQSAVDQDRAEIPEFAELYDLGTSMVVFFLLVVMSLYMVYILLARMLLHGVQNRDHEKLHRWYVITLVLMVVRLFFYLIMSMLSSDVAVVPFFALMGFAYQIYCLLVVRAYKKELLSGEYTRLRENYTVIHKL
jgi:hypothetical protein